MKKLMNKASKGSSRAAVSAFLTAIGVTAILLVTGCTTINFPSDETRPTSFNGVTNFRVK